ncbi:CFEM domain-containing protein [Pochonia chlamydosporia 170]|uniref:CFEM domain-containing protein n=1 Tax=Pochonia chlamydosporia 170 TaxID=1380566 RepID=A0A179G5S9_METCM|nr:CFEM domain-containing protein [Pochonia chlamydosporia 170]OAQ72529.1 CFEM domain-containing protein [Pochonia chlamydosporia 170]
MKSSFVTLAVAVGFAAAQLPQLDKIPKCAYSCVSSYISGTNIAGCKPADIACVCKNKDFIGGISCCLQKDCGKDDIAATISFANQICAASGVDTPKQLVCSTGSGASGSTATKTDNSSTGTGAGATATEQTTNAPTGSGTAATTAASSTKTGGAAPAYGNAGGILGAALAIAAAL